MNPQISSWLSTEWQAAPIPVVISDWTIASPLIENLIARNKPYNISILFDNDVKDVFLTSVEARSIDNVMKSIVDVVGYEPKSVKWVDDEGDMILMIDQRDLDEMHAATKDRERTGVQLYVQ